MLDFFKGLKEGSKEFGECISTIVNSILLSILYFIGIGAISIVSRIAHKKFLEKEIKKDAPTYWENLNLTKQEPKAYRRQF